MGKKARARRREGIRIAPSSGLRLCQALVSCSILFLILSLSVSSWGTTEAPTVQPMAIGWGGSRLAENILFTDPSQPSIAFSGELASDQERLARRLVETGHNGLRVGFAPFCTDPDGFMTRFNSTRLARAFRIAETLGLWIIVDYHGYWEFGNQTVTNETTANCWLEFWRSVIIEFKDTYSRTIWEPLNEPAGFHRNTTMVSYWYQKWIDQARSLGDENWIVVQNVCSYGCSLQNFSDGFPAVSDPLGRVFLSIHPYMPYWKYHSSWNNSTAESLARRYYLSMLNATDRIGLPVFNTEGGPGPLTRTVNGTTTSCPDLVLGGASGFCRTNFHFIQALTNLLDSNQPQRIGWIWWPVGNWPLTPGAGILGAIAPRGWGTLLRIQRTPTFTLEMRTSGSGTTFPGPGNHAFVIGTSVDISATPSLGDRLDHWELNGVYKEADSLSVMMNANHTVVVVFAPIQKSNALDDFLSWTSSLLRWAWIPYALALTGIVAIGVFTARRRRPRYNKGATPQSQTD